MSILDNGITKQQAALNLKARLLSSVKALYARMTTEFAADFSAIWSNADGLTPAEALAALGPDAVEVFTLAGILKSALNAAKPGSITVDNPAVTFNVDGTVVLAS